MPMPIIIELAQTNHHPAVKAWRELQPQRVEAGQVEILKERDKSSIYRLTGVGVCGSSVIAKRCNYETGLLERAIYQEILPQLPLSTLHYYGFVMHQDDPYCWLFLEDAAGEEFSFRSEKHRRVATQWIGTLHISAAGVAAAAQLPDRGPNYYLAHLNLARRNILQNLGNPALTADDLRVLQKTVSQFDILEARWDEVKGFCNRMPQTLVHGDFVGKNIGIREGRYGIAFLVMDWETAGWGVPAADLEQVDIGLYLSVVRQAWPHLGLHDIRQLIHHGTMFRLITATSWASWGLCYDILGKEIRSLTVYQARLANIIQVNQWMDSTI